MCLVPVLGAYLTVTVRCGVAVPERNPVGRSGGGRGAELTRAADVLLRLPNGEQVTHEVEAVVYLDGWGRVTESGGMVWEANTLRRFGV